MTPLPVILAFLAAIASTSAALPTRHSNEFPLRYECDVAPALAGWTLTAGSSVSTAQATNGWLSFISSSTHASAYQHSQWRVGSNQAYTAEMRFRTPRQGRIQVEVADGETFRDRISISSTGLLWHTNGGAGFISPAVSNAMHVVRIAGWTDEGQHRVQMWQDGRSIYGPEPGSTSNSTTGAITAWGDPSTTDPSDAEIDYLRMHAGGAYAPFVPELSITRNPGGVEVNWSMSVPSVYQLQSAHNLWGSEWFDLGAQVPAMTTTGRVHDTTNGKPVRFYRVQERIEGAINQTWSPGAPPPCDNLPAFICVANCLDLVAFEPATGPGYENYPINGETASDQYRSFIRRDVRQAIQHAAARVACETAHWPFGTKRLLGLGDMSEADGSIPGTREGAPSHPAGTHQDGGDIDVAYYQLDTANNHLRAICESRLGGVDQLHCVAPPTTLDIWRTALFVGILLDHPRLRVIGVDGQVGPVLIQAIEQLSAAGGLPSTAPTLAQQRIAYETTNEGRGWFFFHHQYMHISFRD